ncbi:MAG: 1-acyl-sn-glycerol-3-phosphate acyltransferase [Candidatus Omnitrophica bacterium]|nr:1-acyl-sn-glycerol-3-phosphate acyltransferase [Candidatus Omnitrophota bacterium]
MTHFSSHRDQDFLEHPTRFLSDKLMPKYWPPRPNWFWKKMIHVLLAYYVRNHWKFLDIHIDGAEETFQKFGPNDGVLITPNHSHEGDPHILLKAAKKFHKKFYFMAAWQAFCGHGGLDGRILQRMGVFSVDRDGCDRRAVRTAVELLCAGQYLVVFPEGEIHRLNDRLKPLCDGVAYMALSAQRELKKNASDAKIWILPSAIRYEMTDDVIPELEQAMKRLEAHFLWWKPPKDASLQERIVLFGEMLLTIKEKEKTGKSFKESGDLPHRIQKMIKNILAQHEKKYLKRSATASNVAMRVKALRRQLLDLWLDDAQTPDVRQEAYQALDDVQLVLQLSSYPGDYISEKPNVLRLAETIEKFEEDIFGLNHSIGSRRAKLIFGQAIDMSCDVDLSHMRAAISGLTDRLEETIQSLMDQF